MAKKTVECDYCGLPFLAHRPEPQIKVYCCAGCALADRVRTPSGDFPVTPELVLALLAGFAAFNQALFALLSLLMSGEERWILAERFTWVSLLVGIVAWALVVWAQRRAGARRVIDHVITVITGLLLGWALFDRSMGCALIATFSVIGWSAKGGFRARRAPDASRLRP